DLSSSANVLDNDALFKKFAVGDYIVHEDHGVGIFNGVVTLNGRNYLEVKYAANDRLLIPFDHSNKITKYVGSAKHKPVITTLNSGLWNRIKTNVKHSVKLLASELLKLYAMRKIVHSPVMISSDVDRDEFFNFAKTFKYSDTEDQTLITQEIAKDLSKSEPMDRLIVGDVGFGKTELAVRAAFACLNAGYQVAVLAPTTILANQHLKVFSDRLSKYAFRIEVLSRLKQRPEQKSIIDGIVDGKVDLVIGTHRLLQDDVKFKNLGLLIIDEEQRFGVAQKEKLKNKRLDVNVLSTTATPIPRTLNLALSGARDLSILASIPNNRKPIANKFGEFSWEEVVGAIENEIARKGQVYYLHNKVADIYNIQEELKIRLPHVKFAVAHGQLLPKKLNSIMDDFINGRVDVLICTTIIENGLDLPNVNTLIVDNSSMYGLSQLYQIRGRIGRSDKQAYAYFLHKDLKGDATLRLDALSESSDLGSGFILSTKDLEIRGAGNILGRDQSGSINSIGYGLYIQMLNDELDKLKKQKEGSI
ncbi:MAG TPA: DEAD/DEAH box helicase, partial [Candidatus Dojkabacteria bacterium]|nr:DEAD/DEAH box helicase [Candidatus Dojkabacteria bacterium]